MVSTEYVGAMVAFLTNDAAVRGRGPRAIPAAGVRYTSGSVPMKTLNDRRCAGGQVRAAGVGLSGIRPIVPASSSVNDTPLCRTAVSRWTGIAIYPKWIVPL
jgi:hypothetical protein